MFKFAKFDSFRRAYHFDVAENIDLYPGVMLAYNSISYSDSDNSLLNSLTGSGIVVVYISSQKKLVHGNYDQMRDAYRKFYEKLSNGSKDQTEFYYAGHGLQNEGEN